jgi:restriction system protein
VAAFILEDNMGRRRDDGALGDLFEVCYKAFQQLPAWVGPCVAVVVFVVFRWALPVLTVRRDVPGAQLMATLSSVLGWAVAGLILSAWVLAEVRKIMSRRLVDTAAGPDSIRDLPWREFEQLIAECYRRKGYMAEVVGRASGDGGVDIELNGHGKLLLVQCKHWKAYKVGVKEIREFHSVVVSRKADGGIVATSGRFTDEAARCGTGNGIELLDGAALAQLLADVGTLSARSAPQATRSPAGQMHASGAEPAPACPLCGKQMVRRMARKGPNAGSEFWGCPSYPECRGARPMNGAPGT